jgi:hypothetical protein
MAKSEAIFGGPMFRQKSACEDAGICENKVNRSRGCFRPKEGGHYNHFNVYTEKAMELLRQIFPEGKADECNFVLFSTSGVHGSYATIEDIEKEGGELTFVIIQPRLCTIHYGNCLPQTKADYEFLKKVRQTSWEIIPEIGKHRESSVT